MPKRKIQDPQEMLKEVLSLMADDLKALRKELRGKPGAKRLSPASALTLARYHACLDKQADLSEKIATKAEQQLKHLSTEELIELYKKEKENK